jgi:hypothetical protein
MLGNKFSVIDLADVHNMHYYDLVLRHRMDRRCASIRNINYPLPRPPYTGEPTPRSEKEIFARRDFRNARSFRAGGRRGDRRRRR